MTKSSAIHVSACICVDALAPMSIDVYCLHTYQKDLGTCQENNAFSLLSSCTESLHLSGQI